MGPVLGMVTDRRRFDGGGAADRLVEAVGRAAAAGVHLVQLRERDLEARALLALVNRCLDAVRGTRARVLVNERLDVALAAGAHGVHLPGAGVPPPRARLLAPPGFLVGRSVHSAEEARRVAAGGGVDYLVFGPVFDTASKPGAAPAGLAALRAVVEAARVPVLAIGGVTLARLPSIAAAGAAGAAAIGLFADAAAAGASELQTVVREATLAFDTPRSVP